jgi:hypothetical protein
MTDIDRTMMGEERIRIFIGLSLRWAEKVMVLRGWRDPMWFSSVKLRPRFASRVRQLDSVPRRNITETATPSELCLQLRQLGLPVLEHHALTSLPIELRGLELFSTLLTA